MDNHAVNMSQNMQEQKKKEKEGEKPKEQEKKQFDQDLNVLKEKANRLSDGKDNRMTSKEFISFS